MPEMESVETVAAASRGAKLTKLTIQRNTCGPDDVTIDIKYVWQIFLNSFEVIQFESPQVLRHLPHRCPFREGPHDNAHTLPIGSRPRDCRSGDKGRLDKKILPKKGH